MSHFELANDPAAIDAFVTSQNARTDAALRDADYDADVAKAARIMGSAAHLRGLSRRGAWIYNFQTTADHPRGVWRRRADDGTMHPETGWDIVFDLDAYCDDTGADWHWRGAPTCPDNPERVLLRLSQGGSDQTLTREFDCSTKAFVDGGFSFGPERGHVGWLDIDTVLWSSASDGDETESSWPGVVRKVTRGATTGDALFRAEPGDLLVSGYHVEDAAGQRTICVARIHAIGQQEVFRLTESGTDRLPTPNDTMVQHNATHYAYVVKDQGGPKGALMLGQNGGSAARVVMRVEQRQAIDGALFLKDWALWTLMDNMRPRLFAISLLDAAASPVEIPWPVQAEAAYFGYHSAVPSQDETLQINVQGFLTPPQSFTCDLSDGLDRIAWTELWQEPQEFDASGLEVRFLEAVSEDGTLVPYHLVLPKDAAGDVPVLLYGYGGFNVSMAPGYDPSTGALWLQKGCGYAIAYIRGGGEFGPDWHRAAQRQHRHRAFEDFAAIASDMVDRGITRAGRVACHGGSNGGLLTGVMLTRYPDRFGAVWTSVGVHDMLGFHSFPAGRAWIDEYGDPEQAEDAAWLRAYSPMHNVVDQSVTAYPECLVETSDFDDRVDPSHSRRFAALLAEAGQNSLFVEHKGGHGGSSSIHDRARAQAIGYSFLRKALRI